MPRRRDGFPAACPWVQSPLLRASACPAPQCLRQGLRTCTHPVHLRPGEPCSSTRFAAPLLGMAGHRGLPGRGRLCTGEGPAPGCCRPWLHASPGGPAAHHGTLQLRASGQRSLSCVDSGSPQPPAEVPSALTWFWDRVRSLGQCPRATAQHSTGVRVSRAVSPPHSGRAERRSLSASHPQLPSCVRDTPGRGGLRQRLSSKQDGEPFPTPGQVCVGALMPGAAPCPPERLRSDSSPQMVGTRLSQHVLLGLNVSFKTHPFLKTLQVEGRVPNICCQVAQ